MEAFPSLVFLEFGVKADAKKIEVDANDGFEIKSLDVRLMDRDAVGFNTGVKVIEAGKHYEIYACPKEPVHPMTNNMVIHINRGQPNAKIYFRQVVIE